MPIFGKHDEFQTYLGAVVEHAGLAAQQDGSAAIEAQHLLLGIAAQVGTKPQGILAAAGLDHAGIQAALEREFEQSLAVAGVALGAAELPEPVARRGRASSLGATGKLVFERMMTSNAKSDMRQAHVLLAILRAEVGTVPRALAAAGVDRNELIDRVRATLGA
ncbi:Clp protease N-terminal domain-containing protein [Nocardia crassostreae]|uniref:Clp protease N-terminal domain-containing protein n=1 Tax=Nocardia crassostreae TaxID=53428 RepID=UPI00082E915E|nr:Clp protease N-terminal domain-containing protein [Nocardia crassostreae]